MSNQLTDKESESVYRAAYRGLSDEQWHGHSFDVALWPDGDARPISSGCSIQAGAMPVLENVSASDFGDWSIDETTEDEFAAMCMECFGRIELDEDDDGSDEEEKPTEPCVVCGDDSTDWLPVWNGGKSWEHKGTAYHCGCHEDHEVIAAYRKALDEEAQARGYVDADDLNDPENDL